MRRLLGNRTPSRLALCAAAGLIGLGTSHAASIPTRAAMHALEGGPGVLEDFESYILLGGFPSHVEVDVLDYDTIANGQGPGFIVPGIRIIADTDEYQWNPANYTGSLSQEISPSDTEFCTIDFTTPVSAFGVDFRSYAGYFNLGQMQVFAANDTSVLGNLSAVPLPATGETVFFGWAHAAGIGKVRFNTSGWPLIDNVEFYAVPEPAPWMQALIALSALPMAWQASGARRRKALRRSAP